MQDKEATNQHLWCSVHPQGMKPDLAMMQAFQDLPIPSNQTNLQSFLGLINYLQPFIPSLTNKTTYLCQQLAEWDSNPSTKAAFKCVKHWICSILLKTLLTYCDRTWPVMAQIDASEYGLSTTLIQNGQPIGLVSKTLTDVMTQFANTQNECISVLCIRGIPYLHIWQAHQGAE